MQIARSDSTAAPDALAGGSVKQALADAQWRQCGHGVGIMKGVATQLSCCQLDALITQALQSPLHGGLSGQNTQHGSADTFPADELVEQIQHAAAFSVQRLGSGAVRTQGLLHGAIVLQLL